MTGEPEEPPGGARGRLQIEGVEVVVLADAVVGRVAVEPRERAGEDRQLLAGIVADDADLAADLRAFRIQRQRLGLDEVQLRRVVAIEAEVVHRIAIHRVELHFLAIEERGLGGHRARGHDVAVGEDQAALGIDHEAGGLRGGVPLRIEGARRIDVDRHDAAGDALERHGPVGIALDRGRLRHGRLPARLAGGGGAASRAGRRLRAAAAAAVAVAAASAAARSGPAQHRSGAAHSSRLRHSQA